MSIYVNKDTKVIVQGITGNQGSFHTQQMLTYGTKVVGGVTPGKGGQTVNGVPVFNTVSEAVMATGADASIIFVPPQYAAKAILEAADTRIKFVICITEGIPVLDMAKVKHYLENTDTKLLGPNCPGIIVPGETKIGIMPGYIHKKGHVGIISRSGTLTYEAVKQLSDRNIGQSTVVGIGGDPVKGLGFVEVLQAFEEDPDTHAILINGEIGGSGEEEAAAFIAKRVTKPVIAFIGGQSSPKGKRMGHAGAIVMGGKGTAEGKIAALKAAGVTLAMTPDVIGETIAQTLLRHGIKP